ncbi:hypothetical protein [Streptomyces sp. NPDC102487]|uniref:hypothetical protein n=1 Tax=Streptomyces sp. NPDC102487 TaxID=3366182 RepID=UPI0038168A8F
MDQQNSSAPSCAQVSPSRRRIALGVVRGGTVTMCATDASAPGVTTTTASAVEQLLRECREDYARSTDRRDHADTAALLALVTEGGAAR